MSLTEFAPPETAAAPIHLHDTRLTPRETRSILLRSKGFRSSAMWLLVPCLVGVYELIADRPLGGLGFVLLVMSLGLGLNLLAQAWWIGPRKEAARAPVDEVWIDEQGLRAAWPGVSIGLTWSPEVVYAFDKRVLHVRGTRVAFAIPLRCFTPEALARTRGILRQRATHDATRG